MSDASLSRFPLRRSAAVASALLTVAATTVGVIAVFREAEPKIRLASLRPPERYTPPGLEADRAYPMETLSDVSAHTDVIVLATVEEEEELHDAEVFARGEGLLGRRISVRIDEVLWRRPGAPPLPEKLTTAGGSWHYEDGKRRPFVVVGEIGRAYVLLFTHNDSPRDRDGYRWMHEGTLALPIIDGATPTVIRSDKPFFDAVAGKTPAELRRLFAGRLERGS